MQVFISWSGARSRAVADLLDEWLQCVIQAIDPWMSSKDIDRGSLWFSELNNQLSDTKVGIICLTKDNLEMPWILFEAGALAKGLSSQRVCTLLIDLESTDVSNPLAQFNHSTPNKIGLFDLLRTLNGQLGESGLKEKVLEQVFETYWPQFEKAFINALEENPAGEHKEPRSEESVLAELLQTTRTLDRRMRNMERKSTTAGSFNSDLSLKETQLFIETMMESGLSESVVRSLLSSRDYNGNKLRSIMEKVQLDGRYPGLEILFHTPSIKNPSAE